MREKLMSAVGADVMMKQKNKKVMPFLRGLALFAILMFFVCTGMANELSGPVIWDATTVLLGRTTTTEMRNAEFCLRNVSTKSITILSAHTDCGCTTTKVPKGAIAAGATVAIAVKVKPNSIEGPYRHQITVQFDDETISKLYVSGETQYLFKPEKDNLVLKDVPLNAESKHMVVIKCRDGIRADVLEANLSTTDVELAGFEIVSSSTEEIRCELSLVPKVARRTISSLLTLTMSDARQRFLVIPLTIYTFLPVDIRPPVAFFGIVKPGMKVKKTFYAKYVDDSRPSVRQIRDAEKSAHFTTIDKENSMELIVEMVCGERPGKVTGELVLELENSRVPEIAVPYSYFVRK